MRILTRHLAWLYALNVAALTFILMSFVVTIDVFMNLRRFTSVAGEVAEAANPGVDVGGFERAVYTVLVVADLWGPRLLQLFNYMAGLILVGAMGFTCAQLVRHREFVAMLASGLSLRKLAWPFLAVGLVVTMVQALNQELWIPSVAHLLVRDTGDAAEVRTPTFPIVLTPDGEGRFFQGEGFDAELGMIEGLSVWVRDESGAVTQRIVAPRAQWAGDHWALQRGVSIDPGATPPVATPIERIDSPLGPERLKIRHLEGFSGYLSWGQVSRVLGSGGVDNEQRAFLNRARWGRIAMLASNMLTLLAAMPFFLVRMPQPMLGPAMRALPIAGAGLAAAALAPVVALPGVPAPIAAFVPAAVLAPLAIGLFAGMKS
jgi:lipopolysaccharide export LptBFGC system permease protein LptF